MLAKAKASMPIPAPGNKYSTTSLCYLLPTSGTVNDPEPPKYGKRGRRGSFGQLTFPFHCHTPSLVWAPKGSGKGPGGRGAGNPWLSMGRGKDDRNEQMEAFAFLNRKETPVLRHLKHCSSRL